MSKPAGTQKVVNVVSQQPASLLQRRVRRQNLSTALQRYAENKYGPVTVIDMTNRQSLANGAVINMIAHRSASAPTDEQGGHDGNDEPSPPGHDEGGQEDADEEERDQSRDAAAVNQAEYDSLVSSLHQRISDLESASASNTQRNSCPTPSTFQTPTVRLQRGGVCGRVLDLNSTPSTHSSMATTVTGSPGASPLLSAYCGGSLPACAHQAERALQSQQQRQHGALMGGGSSS
jgi:hypothetical protein